MSHPAVAGQRAPHRRLFYALWPDDLFRERLSELVAPILGALPGRALEECDWHVTLCFLGSVDETTLGALRALTDPIRAEAFELHFDRIQFWQEAGVLAAMASEVPRAARELSQALRELARRVGLKCDEQPLRPHLTLARAGRSSRAQSARALSQQRWPTLDLNLLACEFHLAESRSPARGDQPLGAGGLPSLAVPRYARLASHPLETRI